MSCWATSRSITGAFSPLKASPEEHRVTMAGKNQNYRFPINDHPVQVAPGAVPAESSSPVVQAWNSTPQVTGSTFTCHLSDYGRCCLGLGHIMECRKNSSGSYGTYYGKFRQGTKGRTREGLMWFCQEQKWKNRGVSGQKGLGTGKYFTGQYTCLTRALGEDSMLCIHVYVAGSRCSNWSQTTSCPWCQQVEGM